MNQFYFTVSKARKMINQQRDSGLINREQAGHAHDLISKIAIRPGYRGWKLSDALDRIVNG